MNPILKKAILFMVGAASITRDKTVQFVEELKKEGALNEEEGRELVKQMLVKSEEKAGEISRQVKEEVRKAMNEMGLNKKTESQADANVAPTEESSAQNTQPTTEAA
ncbi:MAG: hypothetical protein JNK26_02745 [Candidatus Doudnabacteria bacterium]|nr:hypothetical protein [Candidatus Doudnabacteria bacterium]